MTGATLCLILMNIACCPQFQSGGCTASVASMHRSIAVFSQPIYNGVNTGGKCWGHQAELTIEWAAISR